MSPVAPLLAARGLRKSYGGIVALADGVLTVQPGEIHALLGQNGAGKSTLIKCLAGTPPPDAGSIVALGAPLPAGHGPADAAAAGLAFIHQESALVESLSVEENIALVAGYRRRAGLIDWTGVRATARDALAGLDVEIDPAGLVAELPPAARTAVAIARALAQAARVLVLDEPTASVSPGEARAVFAVLRRLAASGRGVVFVSHRLDEVFELCDAATVLRDGRVVAESRSVADLDEASLVELICGRHIGTRRRVAPAPSGDAVFVAEGLSGPTVAPLSFSVAPGEIVGITGLSDAGGHEVAEMLFGVTRSLAGKMRLAGAAYAPRRPADAIARGVAFVPPERNRQGLAREMTLAENLFLNPRRDASPGFLGLMSPMRERHAASKAVARFQIRPPDPDAIVGHLSGGNAQKVLVARWLEHPAVLLLVADPTEGVDVGAREEIYTQLRDAAVAGVAVLLVSSDFDEVEALCARALILVRGELRASLSGDAVAVPHITAAVAARSGMPALAGATR